MKIFLKNNRSLFCVFIFLGLFLPFMQRQDVDSLPILKYLKGHTEFLPSFIGAVLPANITPLNWKAPCFDLNTAWLELHNKSGHQFGGGTLHIKVDHARSWHCWDIYVFPTPYRMTWDYYFKSGKHNVEFNAFQSEAEYEYVKQRGISIFRMNAGMIQTLKLLRDVLPLISDTDSGEKANLAFLEKHMGAKFELRPQPWVTNINVDEIHSGDFLALSKIRGRSGVFETLEKWATGSYAGHSAVCLRDPEGKLWVGESGVEDGKGREIIKIQPWEEWWNYELTKDPANPHIALLPLHPDIRSKFNETAAWDYAQSMDGKPYGYQNLIFSWIDTVNGNYPPPVDADVIASFFTFWSKILPSFDGNLWNEALNKRLGTQGLDLPDIMAEVEKRGSSFAQLLAIPEQDDWVYSDGISATCVAFAVQLYKAAGVFGDLRQSIQATEFTVKDAYILKIFENESSRLPLWCNDADSVKLPYCQIKGKYRMELPGYNTIKPYPNMNQRCPSMPPNYDRPKGC